MKTMKYVDEYRDIDAAGRLVERIHRRASRRWTLMEVCGGQTHSIMRHGIATALESAVELIHGPGCPVCVTPLEAIDRAQQLAFHKDVILTSFGDMLRVPGSQQTLAAARSEGADVRAVYSPADAVELARANPRRQVVFFAVGFETTTPATAIAVLQAKRLHVTNFSLLVSHVRVQPAMETIAESPDCRVRAFLAAGHVCAVMGCETYEAFAQQYRLPVVITGFEPVDLLEGIFEAVCQLEEGRFEVANRYRRAVRESGNRVACDLIDEVYEVCDRQWRGVGLIRRGGLRLRTKWRDFDAEQRFALTDRPACEPADCHSGDVLAGRIKPTECPSFGVGCTPEHPLGAPMVSSEGACAAYYHYANNKVP